MVQASTPQRTAHALPASVNESLDELAQFGRAPKGGVTRVPWSPELFAAYAWVGDRMRALVLAVALSQFARRREARAAE